MFRIWKLLRASRVQKVDTSASPCLQVGCETQPPYLEVLLCNEVKSVKESPQLGEGPGTRPPLIRVTPELSLFI